MASTASRFYLSNILSSSFGLAGDLGVAVLGEQFPQIRKDYTLVKRLALLKVLVMVDMGPRTAWALDGGEFPSLWHNPGRLYWIICPSGSLILACANLRSLVSIWSGRHQTAGQTPVVRKLRKVEMV